MGKPKDDDYKQLPDGPKEEPAKDQTNGDEEDKAGTTLLLWLAAIWFSFIPMVGIVASIPVWIQGLATAGIGSHFCANGESQCSQSTMMVAQAFTVGNYCIMVAALPAGIAFDKVGGKVLVSIGGAMIVLSWAMLLIPVYGTPMGVDNVTYFVFFSAILMQTIGFKIYTTGLTMIVYWFFDSLSLIFSLFNAASLLSSLPPMFLLPQVGSLVSLPVMLMGYMVITIFTTMALTVLCPTMDDYAKQTEKVTGLPLKKNTAGVLKTTAVGLRVLRVNMWSHFVFLAAVALAMGWCGVYANLSPQYMVALKGDPDNPDPDIVHHQTNLVMIGANAVGLAFGPLMTGLGEKIGQKFQPTVMALLVLMCTQLIMSGSTFAQAVVSLTIGYIQQVAPVFINQRSYAYSSASKVGTVQGMLNTFYSFLVMPLGLSLQSATASLEDPAHSYARFFREICFSGLCGVGGILAIYVLVGDPASPVLLPEDEQDICVSYGCKYLSEVLYILEMEDRELLLTLLSSTDPETQMNLVMHINGERLVETLMQRNIDEIVASIKAGVAWRRKVAMADQGFGMGMALSMGVGGANLAKMFKVDTSKFGQGEAKTLDQFESEVAKGRSKIVVDEKDPSKMKRLVTLVVLRIFTSNDDEKKKMMIQMSEQLPDGRQRARPQLPGTKRGPNDSLKDCVDSILNKYSMGDMNIQFLYDRTEIHEETQESPSYPGVFTVYQKEFVDGYITETSKAVLSGIGLPLQVAWSTFYEKTKYTYLCEWLTEGQATAKGIVVKGEKTSEKVNQTVAAEAAAVTEVKLKSPQEIIRSLEARDYSKKLVFMLQMDDADDLEHWLLTENVNKMREAFVDLENWPDADPEGMLKKFSNLVPEDTLANLMHERPILKPLVVDFLRSDLNRVQAENADKKTDLKKDP